MKLIEFIWSGNLDSFPADICISLNALNIKRNLEMWILQGTALTRSEVPHKKDTFISEYIHILQIYNSLLTWILSQVILEQLLLFKVPVSGFNPPKQTSQMCPDLPVCEKCLGRMFISTY